MNSSIDWNLYRTFLAVADTRSFSAAGRRLRLSHATVGRHVAALEEALDAKLFVRDADGYSLTPTGERLRAEVDGMATSALRAEKVAGGDERPRGLVRVSTLPSFAAYWLMPHMAGFLERYPELELEFISELSPASVRRREADIVIRLYGPGSENLVGKKIGRMGVAFYASKEYAERRGLPARREEWRDHDIIGFAGALADSELGRWLAHVTRDAPSRLRFTSQVDQLHAVRSGLGIALLTCMIGDAYPDFVRVSPDKLYSSTEAWLLAHPDLRHLAPVKAVYEFIAERARLDRELFLGRAPASVQI